MSNNNWLLRDWYQFAEILDRRPPYAEKSMIPKGGMGALLHDENKTQNLTAYARVGVRLRRHGQEEVEVRERTAPGAAASNQAIDGWTIARISRSWMAPSGPVQQRLRPRRRKVSAALRQDLQTARKRYSAGRFAKGPTVGRATSG